MIALTDMYNVYSCSKYDNLNIQHYMQRQLEQDMRCDTYKEGYKYSELERPGKKERKKKQPNDNNLKK